MVRLEWKVFLARYCQSHSGTKRLKHGEVPGEGLESVWVMPERKSIPDHDQYFCIMTAMRVLGNVMWSKKVAHITETKTVFNRIFKDSRSLAQRGWCRFICLVWPRYWSVCLVWACRRFIYCYRATDNFPSRDTYTEQHQVIFLQGIHKQCDKLHSPIKVKQTFQMLDTN